MKTILIILYLLQYKTVYANPYTQPQQVHLSFGFELNNLVITWNTPQPTYSSVVQYSHNQLDYIDVKGYQTKFSNSNNTQYIHRVLLSNLEYNTEYFYRCGDNIGGWSNLFRFNTVPLNNWSPKLAVYGDMGLTNAKSLPDLQQIAQDKKIDAVLHIGDFAYNMHDDYGKVGDQFMNNIEPIAAYVPYMVSVGNHEQYNNYSNYKNRFTMPSINNENFFYNFTMGDACFIAYSTEFYFTDIKAALIQFEWLNKTLQEQTCPWIITFGHRPMYCSNLGHDDCTKVMSMVRLALEQLFYDNHVDIALSAHEHSYQRTYKMLNSQIDSKGLYHIVSGSAGCREHHDPFTKKVPKWSAFTSDDYGYGLLEIVNATHIYWEQTSVNHYPSKVIDSKWYIK